METYRILRFDVNEDTKVIKTGLTLKQAQEHCNREDTHEKGKWFDGYEEE